VIPKTSLPNECVMGSCLAHRKATYWNIQFGYWAHPDGFECLALAGLAAP
jgi:hypothetical protein